MFSGVLSALDILQSIAHSVFSFLSFSFELCMIWTDCVWSDYLSPQLQLDLADVFHENLVILYDCFMFD